MQKRRYDETDRLLENLIQNAEKEVDKIYAKRIKNIKGEIAVMYAKYEKDGELTLAEMTKYNRLEKQYDSLVEELVETYSEVYKLADKTREQQFLENYYRTAYITEYEAQAKLGFGRVDKATVEAALTNPVKELTLSSVLEKNRAEIVRRIRLDVAQGLANGESYGQMAKRLEDALGSDRKKSQLVARVEAGRAQSIGRLKAFEQAEKYGAEMRYIWDSTLDTSVRPEHQDLDGKEADKDGYFHYENMKTKAPRLWGVARMDIRCRCTKRGEVAGYEPRLRRQRNDDGSTTIIEYKTYEEWRKARIDS